MADTNPPNVEHDLTELPPRPTGEDTCPACRTGAPLVGVLCASCSGRIDGDDGAWPEQIVGAEELEADAWLIDRWGRPHPVVTPCLIGREGTGLAIYVSGVSRRHALLTRAAHGFAICDLGSRNGTRVNGAAIEGHHPLLARDVVNIGRVAMVFALGPLPIRGLALVATVRTATVTGDLDMPAEARPSPARAAGDVRPAYRLEEPAGGGGGLLVVDGVRYPLSLAQFSLLEILHAAGAGDHDSPAALRGFVPSSQLLAEIPWSTPSPGYDNVKHLVRRLRRVLEPSPLRIESRRGLGYRLSPCASERPIE